MRTLRTPSLRPHKLSAQAVVTLNGKDHYLGNWPADQKHPPAETRQAYDRLIAEWLASGRRLHPVTAEPAAGISVNEVVLGFWKHAEQHYRDVDGEPTSELNNLRVSLRPLKALYGMLPPPRSSPHSS